jgi:acylpyruvate hydrolase
VGPISLHSKPLVLIALQALAIDVTGRNLQDEAKKRGLPWTTAKGFDTFTPIGCVQFTSTGLKDTYRSTIRDFIPTSTVSDPHNLTLSLAVTQPAFSLCTYTEARAQVQGILKQNGTTADMIFPISRLLEHVSSIMTLEVSLTNKNRPFQNSTVHSPPARRYHSNGNTFWSWSHLRG